MKVYLVILIKVFVSRSLAVRYVYNDRFVI